MGFLQGPTEVPPTRGFDQLESSMLSVGLLFPMVPLLPNGTSYPRVKGGSPQHGQKSESSGTFVTKEVVRTVESQVSVCARVSFTASAKGPSPAQPCLPGCSSLGMPLIQA